MCGAGDPKSRDGIVVYVYTCNKSMDDKCFYDADGDLLIGLLCIYISIYLYIYLFIVYLSISH